MPSVIDVVNLSSRPQLWQLRSRTLSLHGLPAVMGILNVTPDSFSDGGRFDDVSRAVDRALEMQAAGASILDLGGESTRPFADPVSTRDELQRVIPVLERLQGQLTIPVSIDTMKAEVAREAIRCGVEIVNDVSAATADPLMLPLVVESQVGFCAMHMKGTPQTMQLDPTYQDVIEDTLEYLRSRRDAILSAGLPPERLCLDPGIGFGKLHPDTFRMLREVSRYHELGHVLLVGHSRKGFLGKVIGDPQRDRTAATLGVTLALAAAGVQIIRVHDVQATVDALRTFAVAGGLGMDQALNLAKQLEPRDSAR